MSFWADKNKADIELLYEQLRKIASRANIAADKQAEFEKQFMDIHASLLKLQSAGSVKALDEIQARLDKLELWRGEIHRMLIEQNPGTGRPKLTKTGRFMRGILNSK